MKYTITAHKVIAIVSFIVLSSVQFFLLYNTYELKNEHYLFSELGTIGTEYGSAVRGDKVFPGGQRLMDHYLVPNMKKMEDLWLHDSIAFVAYSQRLCDSAFQDLKKANNVDSVLQTIYKKHNIHQDFEYAIMITDLAVAFQKDKYIPIYQQGQHYPFIDPSFQTKDGIHIAGSLRRINDANAAYGMGVSASMDYSWRLFFSLHVDIRHRLTTILRLMMPTFLLSLLSIIAVVLLFFITFRNWLRQKKLSEMKSDFINSITHEFHTPLAAIIVANRTMQKPQVLTSRESMQPLIEVVQRQAERLKMLISQVLDITTLNKITLDKEELAIHSLLDEILLDYRLKLTGNNVRLGMQKTAVRDRIPLDRFWFTTILLNIFDNAVKYNDKEKKEITVSTHEDKKALYISIRDNGLGMAPETKKHIFEKFYRHIRHNNEQVKGLGLGLFYVKQSVDAHNWKIDITSEEGEGSTFLITIPFRIE